MQPKSWRQSWRAPRMRKRRAQRADQPTGCGEAWKGERLAGEERGVFNASFFHIASHLARIDSLCSKIGAQTRPGSQSNAPRRLGRRLGGGDGRSAQRAGQGVALERGVNDGQGLRGRQALGSSQKVPRHPMGEQIGRFPVFTGQKHEECLFSARFPISMSAQANRARKQSFNRGDEAAIPMGEAPSREREARSLLGAKSLTQSSCSCVAAPFDVEKSEMQSGVARVVGGEGIRNGKQRFDASRMAKRGRDHQGVAAFAVNISRAIGSAAKEKLQNGRIALLDCDH